MSQEVSKLLFMFVEFVVLAWEYSFLQFFPNIMCLQISIVCFNVQFIVIELLCLFGSNLPAILLQRYMLVVFCLFWKMAAYLSLSFWFVQVAKLDTEMIAKVISYSRKQSKNGSPFYHKHYSLIYLLRARWKFFSSCNDSLCGYLHSWVALCFAVLGIS